LWIIACESDTKIIVSNIHIEKTSLDSIYKMSGTARDSTNTEPISGANIEMEGKNNYTISEIDGKFILDDIHVNDTITINCVGYKKKYLIFKEIYHL